MSFRAVLTLLVVAFASVAEAQPPAEHHHADDAVEPTPALCLICPVSRETSGTSWQPDATAGHTRVIAAGAWRATVHAVAAGVYSDQRGSRGDEEAFSLNYLMADAHRPAAGGVIGVQSMWSLEPLMGPRGYPLLLQTGETADGVTPLIDRQHPHDFTMEIAFTYARELKDRRAWFLYVAPVGAPALGPPAFMHRPSAASVPIAPITHHWFDSTHITYGVVTFGYVASPRAKLEVSAFRGREPDEKRWAPERPTLDSVAVRASVNPTPALSLQVSAGYLHEVEQLHPGADIGRLTASLMYSRTWRPGMSIDAMVAWGRNNRTQSLTRVTGGFLVFPGAVSGAALAEATVHVASRHALIGRLEHADKDELFGLTDPRHSTIFPVTQLLAGYALDIVRTSTLKLSAGLAGTISRVPDDLRAVYGQSPKGVIGFVQISTH